MPVTEGYGSGMNLDKFRQQVAPLLEVDERVEAAVKVTPRGAAHEAIMRGAGAAGGTAVSGGLAGAGAAIGAKFGAEAGDAGRAERAEAGLDVGVAAQVVLAVTDRRIVLVKRSALGKPKEILSDAARDAITSAELRDAKLFGQNMPEIVLEMASGAEAGFAVAKVDRRDGDGVLEALGG